MQDVQTEGIHLGQLLQHPDLPKVLAANPAWAAELRQLQKELTQAAQNCSQKIAEQLRKNTSPQSSSVGMNMSVSKLKAAARQRESASNVAKETGSHMAIGLMANALNPDWKPNDSSTYASLDDNPVLKLLELPLQPLNGTK